MTSSRDLALLCVLAVLTLGASASAAAPSTQAIWQHHIQAWEARDLAAITADYTDSSVLILNNQTFRGKAAIANVFRQLFQIFDPGQNRVDPAVIDGRIIYITWNYTPRNESPFFGSDSFVVENGKIQVQTIASTLYVGHPVKP